VGDDGEEVAGSVVIAGWGLGACPGRSDRSVVAEVLHFVQDDNASFRTTALRSG
jgi:hypothetical protein